MKKTILFCIIVTLLFSFNIGGVLAQNNRSRALEITYPIISGIEEPTTTDFDINLYARYIYYFAIGIGALLAFAVIVNAGLGYSMSAGDPTQMQNAKSQILAAILGLLILLGSYLLLYTINPNLVTFNIQPLRTTIKRLPSGVLLCKKSIDVAGAWDLQEIYDDFYQGDEFDEMIADEIEITIDEIAKECYLISSSGNIREDFDDRAEYIYFIPHISITVGANGGTFSYGTEYGAILYEDDDYKGKSTPIFDHLIDPYGAVVPYPVAISGNPSSIKPFRLIYEPSNEWNVSLYESYRLNEEAGAGSTMREVSYSCDGAWYCVKNLHEWDPKSMEINGDLLVILVNEPDGGNETFSQDTYNNLESYENIVEWVNCPAYIDPNRVTHTDTFAVYGGTYDVTKCAKASADVLIIISGTIF